MVKDGQIRVGSIAIAKHAEVGTMLALTGRVAVDVANYRFEKVM